MTDVSVVIPVRNEEKNVVELAARLQSVFAQMHASFELIFVTDSNNDNTVGMLKEIHRSDARLKILKLSNSFGHHTAVYAGLAFARGTAVVIMDGDLQDCPEDIPALYAKMNAGYDIVYGIKKKKNDSIVRNFFSKVFVKTMQFLSDYELDFNTSMFRIISRRVADAVLCFKEREPSLTFIMGFIGFPTAKVVVTSGSRQHGKTKYSYWHQINFAISSLVSFSTKPLRYVSLVGLGISALGFFYFLFALGKWACVGVPVTGWTSMMALLGLLGGAILFAQGITGEYIARVFIETKNRPRYVVEETIGFAKEQDAQLPATLPQQQ